MSEQNRRSRIIDFYQAHPIMVALTYLPFYLLGFFLVERLVEPTYILHCPLDDWIPFCEYFIVPYAFWFVELVLVPLLLLRYDVGQYYYLCFVMFVGMTCCLLLYVLLPNGLELRVEITRHNLCAELVRLMQQLDTPTNVCPSIHVASSLAMDLAICRSVLGQMRRVRIASHGVFVLIVLSTVFLKQHSVIDVFWGAVLTLVLHGIWTWIINPKEKVCSRQQRGDF